MKNGKSRGQRSINLWRRRYMCNRNCKDPCAFKKVLYKNYSKEEAEIKYGAVLATADAFSYISCKQEKKENAETDKKIGLDEILNQLILDSLDAIVKKGDK